MRVSSGVASDGSPQLCAYSFKALTGFVRDWTSAESLPLFDSAQGEAHRYPARNIDGYCCVCIEMAVHAHAHAQPMWTPMLDADA